MKLCRFNEDRLGLVDGDDVVDVTGALEVIEKTGWPAPMGDAFIANLDAVCASVSDLSATATRLPISTVT